MKLRVETEIRLTESRERVEAAVKNIFPTLNLQLWGQKLVGESTEIEALSKLHQLLRQQAILDTARSTMLANRKGNTTEFMLNKQVAFVGKVSFTDGESPLGPIIVHLEAPDIERLIDYLAPRTHEGKPIQELSSEEVQG
ncbi:MAG: RNA-binding domain-containing protein [Candidatus Hadarchaeum sp.]|uniref:RNA-binding domain-containing protein n=1 Tax=Candidatus Hadarchaeum sp. TaxID=2883567 RepID=UPI003D10D3A2